MAKTPFLGAAYTSRSKNLADQRLVNLYLEVVETKSGSEPGAFYMTPGLDLLCTCGPGPIRGISANNSVMCIVSGDQVYFVDRTFLPNLLGTIASASGPVSMIANQKQIAFFDRVNGYMIGASYFISAASPATPGTGYVPGDTITLAGGTYAGVGVLTVATTQGVSATVAAGGTGGTNGTQTVTGTTGTGTKFQASVTVAANAITAVLSITVPGSYTVNPTILTAEPVTGAGLTGAQLSVVMGALTATPNINQYSAQPTNPVSQASTSGVGTGATWNLTFTEASLPVLITLDLPFSNPLSATQQDGFGLVSQGGTDVWWQSNLFDFSTWDPLNFQSASAIADNIIALGNLHREIWLIKQDNCEVWQDAGTPGFTFGLIDGVLPEIGCVATYSVANCNESLCWLSQNEEGQGIVVQTEGYQPKRISTHAIEHAIAGYPIITDAIGFCYQQEGHVFYVLQFPSGNATWIYDLTASALAGIPVWHQRAAFLNDQLNAWWAGSYALFSGQNVVGDFANGNLYRLNLDGQTDNGAQRKWLRSWLNKQGEGDVPQRFCSLQLNMQTGIGVPDGTNPQVVLRWSDDGGHTWSNELFAAAGQTGQTAQRVKWNRLGSTRRDSGLERIWEVSSTDMFGVALLGADVEQ